MKILLSSLLVLSSLFNLAYAETEVAITDQVLEVKDSVLGIDIKFDKNGNIVSMKSTAYQGVDFPDRNGINDAYLIAEEEAKTQLSRFIEQDLSNTRVINKINNTTTVTTMKSGSDASGWTKDNIRNVTTSITQNTVNTTRSKLKGVVILERNYDAQKAEVFVTVGMNSQTSRGAEQLKRSSGGISSDGSANSSSSSAGSVGGAGGSFPAQGSEYQRNKSYNNF